MTAQVGFVMLCHTALHRAAQVARHWAERGCPVVIHVDRKVPDAALARLREDLAGLDNIRFGPRHTCEWGTWGLVAATQGAARILLDAFPDVTHAYLVSGACLPLRPVEDLHAYLAANPGVDFIESVTTHDVPWAVGGLSVERFTLRFPFSWRRQRRLFDAYVRLQRRLGIRRRIPDGIVPHLGSQWWCLTRTTLAAILSDPDRPAIDRFFRRVWIPDESYFQTMARRHSRRIESRSLTLAKFDFMGKPHIFYDDHLPLLRRSDCFVARKIWPQAGKLYRVFLTDGARKAGSAEPNPGRIDRLFAKAAERRLKGRTGLYMQSRFPSDAWQNQRTAAPYSVFQGFAELYRDFPGWLSAVTGLRVHGHLFAPDRVEFAGGETVYNGCLSDSASLRDYNPRSFLTNLIWNTRGERQCWQFGPGDRQDIVPFLASDPQASVWIVSGAWGLPLFRKDLPFASLRAEAARLQRAETEALRLLTSGQARARVRVWSLVEYLEAGDDPLQAIADELVPRSTRRRFDRPERVDLTGFGHFLQALRNDGMKPTLTGDYPANDRVEPDPSRRDVPLA